MKALLIDVVNPKVETVDVTDFHQIQKHLNCTCFDVVSRTIGKEKQRFDIYVDDEGLLKDRPIVSAMNTKREVELVGNLLIAKHENGDMIDLSKSELEYLTDYIMTGYNFLTGLSYPVLVEVGY